MLRKPEGAVVQCLFLSWGAQKGIELYTAVIKSVLAGPTPLKARNMGFLEN